MGQRLNLCVDSCMRNEEKRSELILTPEDVHATDFVDDVMPLVVRNPGVNSAPTELYLDHDGFRTSSVLESLKIARDKFMTQLNSDEGLELKVSKSNVQVWTKETNDGFVLKSVWKVPYSAEIYMDYLKDITQKINWDTNLEEAKLICNISSDISICYQRYKRVIPVSPRDFIIASRLEQLPGTLFDISCSVDSPAYPPDNVVVRARLLFGGYYLETIPQDEDKNVTKVVSISETDFGGNLPKNMVKSMAALKMSTFVPAIDREIKKFLAKP
mmetsp:Transcript_16630/g.29925  ORF Transcript_16630/g.29925 Transcript_16630/m.29925 type:complete len:272 (+) Transcript_16630:45-860(+)